jgi:di/tricarboxylate transporter
MLLKGYADKTFPNDNLNFFKFFLYGFPISILMITIEWLTLCLIFLRYSSTIKPVDLTLKIKEKLSKFGDMKYVYSN